MQRDIPPAGSGGLLYLHRDYQGSILAITDENATILEKRQFDAWGTILQVQDGNGNTLNGLTILDRGYTGHEHLQSVGLVHMNGRLYDAKLHRFLQPDNYVQDPSNTQNFNRYGYCWNNPLKFSDPSGEWIHLVIGAVVGGVFNWVSNGAQFNAAGLGYLGTGALAGFTTAATGNPYFGAAIMGAGNSVTTQLATGGKIDVGQVIQGVGMSVAMAGFGAGIGNAIGPYMDKAVGSIITNSILKESLTQALTNSVGGFVIGAGVAGATGASFNDAISSGWSSAKMGFAMGATSGAIKGYIDVKAKTVSNADNATKTQTEATTQNNTTAGNNTPNQKGKAGEIAAGIDPNVPKEQIQVNGNTRIPDALDHTNKTLIEVKNVKQQSFTKQLRDFHQFSLDKGYKMHLYLPANTSVTGPLQQQFNNGTIIRLKLKL